MAALATFGIDEQPTRRLTNQRAGAVPGPGGAQSVQRVVRWRLSGRSQLTTRLDARDPARRRPHDHVGKRDRGQRRSSTISSLVTDNPSRTPPDNRRPGSDAPDRAAVGCLDDRVQMPLELVPLSNARVSVAPPISIPNTPLGTRIIGELTAFDLEGDRLHAHQHGAAAADWATLSPDGTLATIDVRPPLRPTTALCCSLNTRGA